MEEQINAEINKLQDELMELDSAVQHIEKAGKVAAEVLDAIKLVQQKYSSHLDQIMDQYSKFLDQNSAFTQKKVEELAGVHLKQIDEVKKLLVDHEDLKKSTIQLKSKIEEVEFQKRLGFIDQQMAQTIENVSSISKTQKSEFDSQNKVLIQMQTANANMINEMSNRFVLLEQNFKTDLEEKFGQVQKSLKRNARSLNTIKFILFFIIFCIIFFATWGVIEYFNIGLDENSDIILK